MACLSLHVALVLDIGIGLSLSLSLSLIFLRTLCLDRSFSRMSCVGLRRL